MTTGLAGASAWLVRSPVPEPLPPRRPASLSRFFSARPAAPASSARPAVRPPPPPPALLSAGPPRTPPAAGPGLLAGGRPGQHAGDALGDLRHAGLLGPAPDRRAAGRRGRAPRRRAPHRRAAAGGGARTGGAGGPR